MATKEKVEAERLKQTDEDVKRALKQTGGQALKPAEARKEEAEQPQAETRQKLWFITYLLLLVALGFFYYALRLKYFDYYALRLNFSDFATVYRPRLQQAVFGAMAITFVLAVAKAVDAYLITPLDDSASRFNLHRILRLLLVIVIAFIA